LGEESALCVSFPIGERDVWNRWGKGGAIVSDVWAAGSKAVQSSVMFGPLGQRRYNRQWCLGRWVKGGAIVSDVWAAGSEVV